MGNQLNYISSCQFSEFGENQGQYIIASSAMNNMVGIYKKDLCYNIELEIQGIPSSVYTTDISKEDSKFLFATQDGRVYVYKA